MFMGCTNYCVAARVRAIEKMRADFFLDGQPVGSASIGTAFTNVLFRANVIPKPRPNGAPLLLNVITSGTKVPGQVAKGVYDNRPLSLCFDKLTVCPDCGAPVVRVIQAPALGHSHTDLNYRAKRAGFHALKRVQKGEYEKMY